jgi:aspartate aminotransferase-like enzyme
MQLRIPGPTPCPQEVLEAMSVQMFNHRGKVFDALINKITPRVQQVYQTKNDVYILTSSGTGGMEAAVVNVLSPGDTVLALIIGVFGQRFANIAETFGANVKRLEFPWGTAADPDAVRDVLKSDPTIKAVLVTHNETSTGAANDLATISKVVKEFDKLLLVDAISSLSSIDLQTDNWNCDVVVSASQKGWMVPPGIAFVSISERGWQANSRAKMPRFHWDFEKAKSFLEKGQTPWTPAVSLFVALDIGLDFILKEGLPNIFARHARVGQMTREGVKKLGFELFADEKCASNTVTSVKGNEKVDANKLRKVLEDEYGVILAGGQTDLAGKIFRIGHLGYISEKDIEETLDAIAKAMPKAAP